MQETVYIETVFHRGMVQILQNTVRVKTSFQTLLATIKNHFPNALASLVRTHFTDVFCPILCMNLVRSSFVADVKFPSLFRVHNAVYVFVRFSVKYNIAKMG